MQATKSGEVNEDGDKDLQVIVGGFKEEIDEQVITKAINDFLAPENRMKNVNPEQQYSSNDSWNHAAGVRVTGSAAGRVLNIPRIPECHSASLQASPDSA